METDELIRAAMQRTAESARPADVDGVVVEAARQRRRRVAVAASVCAVAALIAGTVAAWGAHVLSESDRAVSPSQREPAISLAEWKDGQPEVGGDVRANAQEVFESFAGTVEQRDAESVVSTYEGNTAMDQCMADAGYPEWDWSLTRQYSAPDDPLKTNLWLAEPMGRWRSRTLLAAKPFLEAEAVMNADRGPDYADAVTACLSAEPSASTSDPRRRLVGRLAAEWHAVIAGFDAGALPDRQVYEDCMIAADITVLRGAAGGQSFETSVAYAMSSASPPDADIPSTPNDAAEWGDARWQKFLSLEDGFFRADWRCRRDVYTDHIAGLGPVIDAFAAEHADEIARASAYWHEVAAEAAALGYTGQRGSLDGIVGVR